MFSSFNISRKEYDECVGCIGHHSNCVFKNLNIQNLCPCLTCLVKVVCTNPCYLFDEKVDSYRIRNEVVVDVINNKKEN